MADESEAMAMMGVVGDEASASAATLFDYAMASSYNGANDPPHDDDDAHDAAGSDARDGTTAAAAATTTTTTTTPTATGEAMAMAMGAIHALPVAAPASAHGGVTTAALFNHELDGELALPDKKTGRPSHPAWEHFVRGSKRNRFHHHAYCKYCSAHGAEAEPVRGVSGNMIRHLQKCIYCPEEIVLQLRVLCAQKDAVNYNKRHHHQSQPPLNADVVDGMIQASAAAAAAAMAVAAATSDGAGPTPAKRLKRVGEAASFSAPSHGVAQATTAAPDSFASIQLPAGVASAARSPFAGKATTSKPKARQTPANTRSVSSSTPAQPTQHAAINQAALNRLVLRATLSSGVPLDWMSMEEAGRLSTPPTTVQSTSVILPSRVAVYNKDLVSSLASTSFETQISRLKEEASFGSTLTINYWFNKAERTNLMLFSLVNAHGEATAWKLVDVGAEDVTLEELSTQIKSAVIALGEDGVQLIAIVTDNLLAYAAAKTAVTTSDDSNSPIAVLPSFEAFLINAMGVILTISEAHLETMGHVIELVAAFSNARLRDTLRRECGDPDATLVLPCKDKWFSFIDCIDSVRQFEDMIKIIGLRVVIHQSEAAAVQRGEESADTSSSSKTQSVLSGSVPDVPARVLETIQNPQFWETVVSLSELMSPIKETYKVMLSHNTSLQSSTSSANAYPLNRNTSSAIMTFSLSDVFYQLGRMYQQYTAIITDWEENPSASRAVSHVRYLQEQVNKTWKLYDQPLMFLTYTLNYNMAAPLIARNLPALQWLSIGKYAKEYFRRWFCVASGPGSQRTGPRGSALNEEASTQFLEDILAFKERKYPFDAESVCDFENPRAFYQLISDSNPLMHLFGTRLFSIATSVPQLARVVPGKSSVTRVSTSACSQELLFPLLQVNLRQRTSSRTQASKNFMASLQQGGRNARRPSNSDTSVVALESDSDPCSSGASSLLVSASATTSSGIWNDREWRMLAKQWKVEWEHEGNVGNVLDTVASLSTTTGVASRLLVDLLSLDQIFKDKLPSRLQQSREEEAVVDV